MLLGNVFCVIVTYADRFEYLRRTVDAALSAGVAKVIIVDNNSETSSRNRLKSYEQKYKALIDVIYLTENHGSAGGFKRGLEYCYSQCDCEYVWLLDDDNMPANAALMELSHVWREFRADCIKKPFALLSFRDDRPIYRRAVEQQKPDMMLGRRNSFLGFHILDIREIIKTRIRTTDRVVPVAGLAYGKVLVAPYGGLFFSRSLLDVIGYPDESYFVYGDDFEFSRRISVSGGGIYLVLGSRICDLERSFHLTTGAFGNRITNASKPYQCYYLTRNAIRFEKVYVNSTTMYLINATIYTLLTGILVLLKFSWLAYKNYIAYFKGIKHAFQGISGRR